MRLRFIYRRGVEDELRKDSKVLGSLDTAGDRIVSAAKSFAPVRTGRLRTSIVAHRENGETIVRATAPYAAYVEFGTTDTPAAHPLAKAVATVSATN